MRPMESLGGGKLKDRILAILSIHYPLSTKKIFSYLKKNYQISITYQGVHKAIKEMTDDKILTSNDKEYKINIEWLNSLEIFSKNLKENYNQKPIHPGSIKVISFDMDGCLFDNTFDEIVWRKEIPAIYAREFNMSFEKAFEYVTTEYKRLWGKVDGWRDVEFWLDHFKLKTNWMTRVEELKKHITTYGDVIPVISELNKSFKLIIISHADRKFLDLKLKTSGLDCYFEKTYSTVTDFKEYKKNKEIFLKVCADLDIKSEEMIHLGDSIEYDFNVPTSAGIRSYLIDRIGTEKNENTLRDLYKFKERLL